MWLSGQRLNVRNLSECYTNSITNDKDQHIIVRYSSASSVGVSTGVNV